MKHLTVTDGMDFFRREMRRGAMATENYHSSDEEVFRGISVDDEGTIREAKGRVQMGKEGGGIGSGPREIERVREEGRGEERDDHG